MNIVLLVVGKIKERYLTEGINEYLKRIDAFCSLKVIELKEVNTNDVSKNVYTEGQYILENIADNDYLVTLEIEGKQLDSVELSKMIEQHYTYNNRRLVFAIGGSDGLSDEVKIRSNFQLSFSKFTFPHQLMRLVFLEQLYRSFMIINNHKYHK